MSIFPVHESSDVLSFELKLWINEVCYLPVGQKEGDCWVISSRPGVLCSHDFISVWIIGLLIPVWLSSTGRLKPPRKMPPHKRDRAHFHRLLKLLSRVLVPAVSDWSIRARRDVPAQIQCHRKYTFTMYTEGKAILQLENRDEINHCVKDGFFF